MVLYATLPSLQLSHWPSANKYGAQFSVALFVLIDAASYSKSTLNGSVFHFTFVDWIPGIFSALGMIVINSIDKTRLSGDGFSYSGDGVAWKARVVLFMGFAAMAGGLAGGVCVMVLKYVVNDASWPALWMGVANVIANALVMLRYVSEELRVRVKFRSHADILQFRHPVGEPEYGGRLHLQLGFVRLLRRTCLCSNYLLFVYIWEITCQNRNGAFERTIHMPLTCRHVCDSASWLVTRQHKRRAIFTVNSSHLCFLVTVLTLRQHHITAKLTPLPKLVYTALFRLQLLK